MELGQYRLLMPLGAGRDGVAYRGESEDGRRTEIHLLLTARDSPLRWQGLAAHLRRLPLLRHQGALPLVGLVLDESPPHLAYEELPLEEMASTLVSGLPWPAERVRELGLAVCDVLLEAHRLGVAPLSFGPASFRGSPQSWRLELSGLRVLSELPVDHWHVLTRSCRPPEERSATWQHDLAPLPPLPVRMAANVFSLGALLHWLATGEPVHTSKPPADLADFLIPMTAADASARPLLREVRARLLPPEDVSTTRHGSGVAPLDSSRVPPQLGRFRLVEKLGQGGMGAVYRAEDLADGSTVAVKVMRPELASDLEQLRRFHKESRLQSEVRHANIINLLEVNEDQGYHYLVLEYARGQSLADLLQQRKRLTEGEALELFVPVARGLAHIHQVGIVHRDIKPENILLSPAPKVSDFGLARHVVESHSLNVTRPGTVLGTPWYMAPEQGGGDRVDARSDVYALGASVFHVLTGRPPFDAPSALTVLDLHRNEPVPSMHLLQPDLSEGICRVVERALAKSPSDRYPDAGALLEDLERLQQGSPTPPHDHPRRPEVASADALEFEFSWDLASSPLELWPHVSNTDRLNRALGLPAVEWSTHKGAVRGKRLGKVRHLGLALEWIEHPFEWVEGQRLGVLREFRRGPFRWLLSVVDLVPHGKGTRLRHRLQIEPRHLAGRWLARVEAGWRLRRKLEQIYRRIDETLTSARQQPAQAPPLDPYAEGEALSRVGRSRLEEALQKLLARGLDSQTVRAIGDHVATASPQALAHVRPYALARQLRLDREQVANACLHGVSAGLFTLLWDLLCPTCRQPADTRDSLKALRNHANCPACQNEFEVDLSRSVELVFRVHPAVRVPDTASYCIGGPAHAPHVIAQLRLAPGERLELDLGLPEGTYRLQGPQLPGRSLMTIEAGARLRRWEVNLSSPADNTGPIVLLPGGQRLVLSHDEPFELLVRLERVTARDDALTAARASALSLFRDLFPEQIVSADELLPVSLLTFLLTEMEEDELFTDDRADAVAFGQLRKALDATGDLVRRRGGAVVKILGEGLLAAFDEPLNAVQTAVETSTFGRTGRRPAIKVAVHRGPALVVSLNDQLDYFGATLHLLRQLPRMIGGGELVLTQSILDDPGVRDWLTRRGLTGTVLDGATLREILYCFGPVQGPAATD